MNPHAIEVEIGELILHGVSPVDALRVAGAAREELARLLEERGLPGSITRGAEIDTVDAGSFTRDALSTPRAAGADLARAIYGGLDR